MLSLLQDDKEWIEFIQEAANWATGTQLRKFFATFLTHYKVTNAKTFGNPPKNI